MNPTGPFPVSPANICQNSEGSICPLNMAIFPAGSLSGLFPSPAALTCATGEKAVVLFQSQLVVAHPMSHHPFGIPIAKCTMYVWNLFEGVSCEKHRYVWFSRSNWLLPGSISHSPSYTPARQAVFLTNNGAPWVTLWSL